MHRNQQTPRNQPEPVGESPDPERNFVRFGQQLPGGGGSLGDPGGGGALQLKVNGTVPGWEHGSAAVRDPAPVPSELPATERRETGGGEGEGELQGIFINGILI